MANTWTWSSTSSTNMNSSANYTQTGSGTFAAGDLVYPNTAGLANAITTAALSCNSWNVNASVTYTVSMATFVLTCNGSTASGIAGGSTSSSLGAGVTLAGNSLGFTVASGLTVATTACMITSSGTSNTWTDNRTSVQYLGVNVTGGSLTTSAPNATNFVYQNTSTLVTIAAGTTLTTNSNYIELLATGNTSFYSMTPTSIWNGNARIYMLAYANGITVTMPYFYYSGTAQPSVIIILNNNNTTIKLTGNVMFGYSSVGSGLYTEIELYNSGTGTVFDFNGFSLTCGEYSAGGLGGSITIYYRNSTLNCTSFVGSVFNTGTCTEVFGTSTINCSGNVTIGSTHTIISGSETWNITSTSTITPNGKMLGTINFNSGTNTITLGGNIFCKYYWILGKIARSTYSIYGTYLIYIYDVKSRQVIYKTMPLLPSKHPLWTL